MNRSQRSARRLGRLAGDDAWMRCRPKGQARQFAVLLCLTTFYEPYGKSLRSFEMIHFRDSYCSLVGTRYPGRHPSASTSSPTNGVPSDLLVCSSDERHPVPFTEHDSGRLFDPNVVVWLPGLPSWRQWLHFFRDKGKVKWHVRFQLICHLSVDRPRYVSHNFGNGSDSESE
jgi:hypothetical protein